MSGSEPTAGIKIGLDTKTLEAEIKKLNDTFKGSFTEIRSAWGLLKEVGQGVWSTFSGAADAMARYAAEADEANRATRQANTLLVDQNRLSAGMLASLMANNDARERSLGVSAEEQLQLQTRLSLAGLNNDQLEEATRLSIGLASVTGNDLASSMRAVTQAYEGNYKLLERLGFAVGSANDLHALSANLYKNAEAEADTYGGQLKRLDETFGDLREKLGGLIADSPTVKTALGSINDGLRDFGDILARIKQPFEWYLQGIDKLVSAWKTVAGFGDVQRGIRSDISKALGFSSDKQVIDYAALGEGARPWDGLRAMEDYDNDPTGENDTQRRLRELQAGWGKKAKGRTSGGSKGATGLSDAAQAILSTPSFEDEKSAIIADRKAAAYQRQGDALRDLGQFFDDYNRNLDLEEEGLLKAARAEETHTEALDGLKESLGSNALGTLADGLGSVFAALASGADAGDTLKAFFGDLISMLGTMLIQLGTAAVLAGALGTAVPLFAGLAGPQAVALGGALILGGIAMKGIGGALGGSGGGGDASTPSVPRAYGGQPGSGSRRASGGELPQGIGWNNAGGDTNVFVEFNGLVTDPKGVARQLRDVMRKGDLKPGWSR